MQVGLGGPQKPSWALLLVVMASKQAIEGPCPYRSSHR
jgi:hypothetical protein